MVRAAALRPWSAQAGWQPPVRTLTLLTVQVTLATLLGQPPHHTPSAASQTRHREDGLYPKVFAYSRARFLNPFPIQLHEWCSPLLPVNCDPLPTFSMWGWVSHLWPDIIHKLYINSMKLILKSQVITHSYTHNFPAWVHNIFLLPVLLAGELCSDIPREHLPHPLPKSAASPSLEGQGQTLSREQMWAPWETSFSLPVYLFSNIKSHGASKISAFESSQPLWKRGRKVTLSPMIPLFHFTTKNCGKAQTVRMVGWWIFLLSSSSRKFPLSYHSYLSFRTKVKLTQELIEVLSAFQTKCIEYCDLCHKGALSSLCLLENKEALLQKSLVNDFHQMICD